MSFGIPVRNGLGLGLTPYTSISSGVRGTRPAMSLDFLNTTSLSGMVTFSRGSNATLVDSTGKITYAPANLLLRSEEFDNASWAKSAATVTANTTVAPDGTATADSLLDTAATSSHYTYQTPATLPATGNTVIISAYAKASTLTYVTVGITDISSGSLYAVGVFNLSNGTVATSGAAGTGYSVTSTTITSVGDGWYRCSVTCVVGTSASFIRATVGTNKTGIISAGSGGFESYLGNGSGIFIWGAQLEPVTYQTTPSTYVATTTAAYYGPRFDYDPVTLAAKGLLIEEQRTNLALYSEQFDNAAWAKAKITATVDAIASPSGSSNADKISSNISSAGGYLVSQNPSVTSGTAYTASAYLKKAELGFAFLFVTGGTPTTSVSINLTTGAATTGTGSPLNVSSVDAGNGWWRVSFNVVATLSTLGGIAVYLSNDGVWANRNDAIAVNSGIYLWGAQLEAGAFATSYIPTVASTVTRSADVATMTGTNFSSWYNQTEGTFVAEADTVGTSTRSVVMVGADDNNRVQIAHTGSTDALFRIVNAGVAANPANIAATKTGFKAALAYKQSDAAASVGASAVTTSSPTSMVAHTAAYLGSNAAAGLFLNGHIRQIAYYNTRLPNATLQTLTEIPGAYSASYLVVAGGASGGSGTVNIGAGGGGAGGLLSGTSTVVLGTTYAVAVGGGGAVQSANGNGNSGNNSSALSLTATGGGGGAGSGGGVAGGSGGGGSGTFATGTTSGGAGTSGQGNNGGSGQNSDVDPEAQVGGGGGGSSAVGSAGTGIVGGNGGAGTASSITGSSVTYAGGGGGGKRLVGTAGTGGTGGGGNGGAQTSGSAGTANRGGGGGGAGANGVLGTGGAGGSGVVILSVPTAKYTGTTTGSPTVTTSGANTILTFTSSGSYTA